MVRSLEPRAATSNWMFGLDGDSEGDGKPLTGPKAGEEYGILT